MDYETNIATTPHDILSKLNTFLSANGWTVDAFEDIGGGDANRGWRLAFNNGTLNFGLRSFVDADPADEGYTNAFDGISGIACIGFTSFNAADELKQQTGAGQDMVFMQLESDLCDSYHFFADSVTGFLAIVAERTSGKFSAIAMGATDQDLRQFYTGTSSRETRNVNLDTRPLAWWGYDFSNYVRKVDNSWAYGSASVRSSNGNTSQSQLGFPNFITWNNVGVLRRASTTAWNANSIGHMYQYEKDDRIYNSPVWRLIGAIPNIFICDMRTLEPNDLVTIGANQYIVFPVLEKQSPYNPNASQDGQGFMVRKV